MHAEKSPTLDLSVAALTVASLAAFVFSRLFINIGLPLPRALLIPEFDAISSFAAIFSVELSYLLSSLVLVLVTWRLLTGSGIGHVVLAFAFVPFVLASLLAAYASSGQAESFGYAMFFAFALLALLVSGSRKSSYTQKVAAASFALSYFTSYFTRAPLILEIMRLDAYTNYGSELFQFGELLVLLAPVAVYAMLRNSLRRRGVMSYIVPSVIAIAFSLMYIANAWVVSTVAMLTLGLSLFLPFPLYAVSLWLYSYVVFGLTLEDRRQALGLVLVLLAGRRLEVSYLGLVAMVGVLLIFHNKISLEKPSTDSIEVMVRQKLIQTH